MKFYECPMCGRIFAEWEWESDKTCPRCGEHLIKTDGDSMALDDRNS